MNTLENFKICCTTEEVTNISEYLTLDTIQTAMNLFDDTLKNYDCDEWIWKKCVAISKVYTMGYISGCRTIRKKHKGAKHNVQKENAD